MSKQVFNHPAPQPGEPTGPSYWRSLDERNKTPEFRTRAEREFVDGAAAISTVERREFLLLMGASFGLAGLGLAGCREPRNHTLPYSKQPENTIPGVATYYASSFPGEYANQALIVETHQHRPTKVEGNPSHAANGTASSKFAQASVLDLYDPERAQASQAASGAVLSVAAVRDLLRKLSAEAKANGGAGLAFLARPSTSPTRARVVAAVKAALPQARFVEYTPVAQNRADAVLGFRALPDLAKARRILSLDGDRGPSLLECRILPAEFLRQLVVRREDDEGGAVDRVDAGREHLDRAAADHRLRAASSHISGLAILFAAEVLAQTGKGSDAATLRAKVSGLSTDAWIKESIADLVAAKGKALIVAGDHLSADAHRAVAVANAAL
ncbi:MAG: Tetrathionate reductase subunit precursor, partial [Verrucomicrobiota bacterium]